MHPSVKPRPRAPTGLGQLDFAHELDALHVFHWSAPPVSLPSMSRHPNGPAFSQLSQILPSQNRRRQKLAFTVQGPPTKPEPSTREQQVPGDEGDGDESNCPVEFQDMKIGEASGSEPATGTTQEISNGISVHVQVARSRDEERRELARPLSQQRKPLLQVKAGPEASRTGTNPRRTRSTIGFDAWSAQFKDANGQFNPDLGAVTSDPELQSEGRTPSTEPEPTANP